MYQEDKDRVERVLSERETIQSFLELAMIKEVEYRERTGKLGLPDKRDRRASLSELGGA
jgi:hypothetical protein